MTDNEIVKALECCTAKDGRCEDCPYEVCFIDDNNFLLEDALDLINRQKAEIDHFRDVTKMIRAEAIKEFAERLKRKFCTIPEHHFSWIGDELAIDDLVKEMTEETV